MTLLHEDYCNRWEDKVQGMPKLIHSVWLYYKKIIVKYGRIKFKVCLISEHMYHHSFVDKDILLSYSGVLEVCRWTNKPVEERLCSVC